MTVNGYRVSFWGDEDVLKLIVMVVHIICGFYLNKAVTNPKQLKY